MHARIPQSFIDELLTRSDIVSVIERYMPIKKAGSNYQALCPFHNEKSPSFSISPSKQFYYCFGCGASGNAISFLMDYERMGFLDAVETLAAQAGLEVPKTAQVDSQQSSEQKDLFNLTEKAQAFYHEQLFKNPNAKQAQQYIKSRGLSHDIIKQFGIGFAPDGWDHLLKHLGSNDQRKSLLLKAGLLIENDKKRCYDRFRNRITFPIRDRRGRTIGFGGRVMDDSTPKYLNSPETPLFHKGQELYGLYEARMANRELKHLIVVEGYMDVISLAQHGINYAVATLGTAVTSSHLQRLLRTCSSIVFCFDGDAAGQRAAWKALEIALPLINDQSSIRFMFMPKGQDPDSIVRAEGQTGFEKRLNHAASLSTFLFDHLSEQVNLETLDGRAQLASLAMPYLQKITADITKTMLIDALSKLTRTDTDKLQHWSKSQNEASDPYSTTHKQSSKTGQQTPVRLAITLLLQHPHLAQQANIQLPSNSILKGLPLLTELNRLLKQQDNMTTGKILEHWRHRPEIKHLAKLASYELLTPESGLLAEFEDVVRKIKELSSEQEIEHLLAKGNAQTLSADEKQKLHQLIAEKQKR